MPKLLITHEHPSTRTPTSFTSANPRKIFILRIQTTPYTSSAKRLNSFSRSVEFYWEGLDISFSSRVWKEIDLDGGLRGTIL